MLGYDIVPLCTAEAMIDEAAHMANCLHGYADGVRNGICRLFAVRRGDVRIGTLEVRPSRAGHLQLGQFCGPGNASPTLEAWMAVNTWWEAQPQALPPHTPACHHDGAERTSALLTRHGQACALPPDFWEPGLGVHDLSNEALEMLSAAGAIDRQRAFPVVGRFDLRAHH